MKRRFAVILGAALLMMAGACATASASEPRPWLCRDMLVFSSKQPMKYAVNARPGSNWRLFFMHLEPGGPQDGFSIVDERRIGSRGGNLTGTLNPGRYYAVSLHDRAGYWICPAYVDDESQSKPNAVAAMCFGKSGPGCLVDVTVTANDSTASTTRKAP
jgi:hypothetical protein